MLSGRLLNKTRMWIDENPMDKGGLSMLEHPEIGWIERTGYPSWMQERNYAEDDEELFDDLDDVDEESCDEDWIYEERRDCGLY